MLSITSNIADVRGMLADLVQQQLPFALSRAVNTAALEARDAFRATLPGHFIIRRPWATAKGAFPVTLSNKRDAVKRATIRVDPSRGFWDKFEEGGTKTGLAGRKLVVPLGARPSPRAVVPKNLQVRALHLTATRTKAGKVQLKGERGTFVIKTATRSLIMQRRPRAGLRVLHEFRRSVPIRPMLHFHETITGYVRGEWDRIAGEALRNALRGAR